MYVFLGLIVGVILLGGIKRIGKATEKLVPFMALLYVVLGVGVIIINIENIPSVFRSIFEGAFNPASITGGVIGSFFLSMKKGVSRGIFSMKQDLVLVLLHMLVQIQRSLLSRVFLESSKYLQIPLLFVP